jgi:hypothetical protein
MCWGAREQDGLTGYVRSQTTPGENGLGKVGHRAGASHGPQLTHVLLLSLALELQ